MAQDMEKYTDLFVEESKDRLEELDRYILELEKEPKNLVLIKDMFRTAHTLKGMAATMAFNNMAHLTHQMENILDIIAKGKHTADEKTISLLFECRDILENAINQIEAGQTDESIDYSKVLEHLDAYIQNISKNTTNKNQSSSNSEIIANTPTNSLPEGIDLLDQYRNELELNDDDLDDLETALEDENSIYLIKIQLYAETEMKYARAYLCIKKIKDFGQIYRLIPDEEVIKEEAFGRDFKAIVFINYEKKIKYLQQDIESVAAVERVEIISLKTYKEDILGQSDKISTIRKGKAKDRDFSIQNVKVSIKHLDNLMNLTGELLIAKIRLDKVAQQGNLNGLNETLNLINRITFDLQDEVLQMRMIPVAHIFDRFPRMVRDLAKQLNKMIDFSMEGRDIELDRTIIDQIGDPIVHLLRNSIDHGIESPEEREQSGKNRIAILKLSAYRDKNYVVIETSDDGSGIDFQKIKQKALDRHLITNDEASKMTEVDLKRLLLAGGISTADSISEISGRGVGLGVVKQKIESLGGLIDVESRLGKGTTFRLKLPLTVAIIKSLLVSLGSRAHEEIYAIPITNVVRTIVIHEDEIRTIKNKEVITILGKIVSLVRLRELVQFNNINKEDEKLGKIPMKTIIVLERNGLEVGLLVDNLIGQQEIVIKNLGGLLKGVKGVSGGAILGDGKVALIIDVSSLF